VSEAFDLSDRVAVITGAGGGLGQAVAVELGCAGAVVVTLDVETQSAEKAADLVRQNGGAGVAARLDVTDKAAVDRCACDVLEDHGRLDIWVNMAAIRIRSPVIETIEADLDAQIAVNLKGVYWGSAAAGRAMIPAGRGSIINFASAGGEVASPGSGAYGMTKAGVIQLTRTLATELGPYGIRVNSVAPGFVETAMTAQDWTREDGSIDEERRITQLEQLAALVPLRRIGSSVDIANCVLYLAGDASSFTTGQVLRPNGGAPML
jgi:3-oxoacyl-[acyl-carrier protein] reductase